MSNMLKAMNLAAPGFTRRKFLKGLAVGAGVASLGSYEAAAQMVAGPRVRPVRGWGVPEGFIRLSSNENPIGPSPRAVEAIMQYVYKFNRYYRGRGLYGQIAERHGLPVVIPSNNNEDRTEPWVTLGCGSSDVPSARPGASRRDGGPTTPPPPGNGGGGRPARSYGARARLVRTTPDFHQDLDAMKAAITEDTRVVVITSPGNPTGIIAPFDDLKKFVSEIPTDVMVFVDEAYIEFARNPQDRIGAAPLILDHENVIVTRTFSKIMGMAGLRIGYGLARPHVIEKLEDNKGGRVSSLSVVAAEACIEDQDYQDRARAAAWAGHDYLTGQFEEMGLEYVPSQSSFMLVNVRTDADEVTRKLFEEYNVLVGNGKRRWRMNNWLRVTAGLQAENEAFIAALKKVLVSS
ncbi:MAG: aminotransferase class I/II-fold pyridoxal phosphate-dependent enzyme [Gemmatimonadetes bacterium]|nr:aminotransferase class I/II-fold pyridoxal phosphate-dependent enzyme [Gemmatimonadota bacterium]